jgi:hypothetical protein
MWKTVSLLGAEGFQQLKRTRQLGAVFPILQEPLLVLDKNFANALSEENRWHWKKIIFLRDPPLSCKRLVEGYFYAFPILPANHLLQVIRLRYIEIASIYSMSAMGVHPSLYCSISS